MSVTDNQRKDIMQRNPEILSNQNIKLVVNSQRDLITKYLLKLNQQLAADYLFIAQNNKDSSEAHSLITISKQQVIDNFSYKLTDSPCERVFNKNVCVYPCNAAGLFPKDEALTSMGIEGYMGIAMLDDDNRPMGILVALFKQEVQNLEQFTWSFEVFADHLSTLIQNAFINEQIVLQNRLLEEVSHSASIGYWELDRGSQGIFWSPQVYKMLGMIEEENELPLFDAINWFHPSDRQKAKQFFQHASTNNSSIAIKLRIASNSGVFRSVLCRVCDDIKDDRIIGVIQDITDIQTMSRELNSSKQELFETEKMLQDIMDCSPAVIYVKATDGKYLFVNDLYTQILGQPREQVIGKTDLDFLPVPEKEARVFMENDRKVIESQAHMEIEEEVNLPDGKRLYVSEKFPLIDSNGEVYALCGISTDITQRRNQETQLRQSQKMEAIGQLAGGIAHDFNNQLASILGFAELIEITDDLAKIKAYIKKIILSADNSSDLTRKLLSFARKDDVSEEQIDLHLLIYETIELLSHTIDKQIEIDTNLQLNTVFVTGNKSSLQNVLINLGLNARDAMPEGGTFTIGTQPVENTSVLPFPGTKSIPTDCTYVELRFSDTGIGMSEKIIGRIFEPFFTTKEVGKGTGMGLALVYGIVESMGGLITVESQPGQGSSFRLFLPTVDCNQSEQESPTVSQQPNKSKTKTILVVDDESTIRNLCHEFFELSGYRGLFAADGVEALTLYKEYAEDIDLVILDMIMPNMNGEETFFELKKLDANVNVLLASGYTAELSVEHLIAEGAHKLMHKPFKLAELKASIEECM